tara:strand:+ start:179 stop:1252 length:1074 start_codon:yes stop_codon:yes gene_type:complete
MAKLNYTVRSREIVDLVNALNGGSLILKPYFQRNLVWRDVHKKEFIDTILKGLPFPQIFLARGTIDVDSLQSSLCVVDGQQRLNAIREFVANKFDVDGKSFKDLEPEAKSSFLKYEVAVIDFDLDPEDPLLQEIFQRLNRTYYSLTSVEKLSSEFAPSELMILAKTLIGEYEEIGADQEDVLLDNVFSDDPNIPPDSLSWAKDHGDNEFADLVRSERIFTSQDTARKGPLMIVLNVICSHLSGYYNRNNEIKKLLEQHKENLEERDEIFGSLCDLATNVFQKLPLESVWLNKANFFTVCVEVLAIDNPDYPAILETLTGVTSDKLSDDYSLAAREAVNNKKQRETRADFVRALLGQA